MPELHEPWRGQPRTQSLIDYINFKSEGVKVSIGVDGFLTRANAIVRPARPRTTPVILSTPKKYNS